ncbi:amino acid ABC transporter [Motiliproteus coralliicola]|uniref:Amino acid ABC transporter n=1 Tax=Motiliproteus coralliicola TaxID=2283196 RepID=A0A369WW75_9GAMM|nr:transporter substrate-binding domain-containing protein [Motiliproteus coralliicola]RDE25363.1 amino acid ABC transporter [Motiliproteus coralliicola]
MLSGSRLYLLSSLVITLCLVAVPLQQADAADPIEYAYPDQSVWTTFRDSNGVLKNPLLGLAKEIFNQANLDWYSTPYPAKRMFKRLKEGRSMFSMLVRASSLKECCLFSEKPITSTELRVYRRKDAPAINHYRELEGKRVVALLGYSYGKIGRYVRDNANRVILSEAARHDNAFKMLRQRRVDYVLDYAGPSEEMLEVISIPTIDYDVLTRLDVYLVLNKTYPDAQLLMQRLESIANSLDIEQILAQ